MKDILLYFHIFLILIESHKENWKIILYALITQGKKENLIKRIERDGSKSEMIKTTGVESHKENWKPKDGQSIHSCFSPNLIKRIERKQLLDVLQFLLFESHKENWKFSCLIAFIIFSIVESHKENWKESSFFNTIDDSPFWIS